MVQTDSGGAQRERKSAGMGSRVRLALAASAMMLAVGSLTAASSALAAEYPKAEYSCEACTSKPGPNLNLINRIQTALARVLLLLGGVRHG